MIRKFPTYEEASFFVEEKRSEGYYATILNEGTGFLWGPPTVGGFRVFVSDEPGEIPEEPIDDSDHWLTRFLRVGFVAVLIVGGVAAVIGALIAFVTTFQILLGLLVVLVIAVGGGYLVTRINFRDPPGE